MKTEPAPTVYLDGYTMSVAFPVAPSPPEVVLLASSCIEDMRRAIDLLFSAPASMCRQ